MHVSLHTHGIYTPIPSLLKHLLPKNTYLKYNNNSSSLNVINVNINFKVKTQSEIRMAHIISRSL